MTKVQVGRQPLKTQVFCSIQRKHLLRTQQSWGSNMTSLCAGNMQKLIETDRNILQPHRKPCSTKHLENVQQPCGQSQYLMVLRTALTDMANAQDRSQVVPGQNSWCWVCGRAEDGNCHLSYSNRPLYLGVHDSMSALIHFLMWEHRTQQQRVNIG